MSAVSKTVSFLSFYGHCNAHKFYLNLIDECKTALKALTFLYYLTDSNFYLNSFKKKRSELSHGAVFGEAAQ